MFHNGKPFVKNFVAGGTTATAGTLGHCQGAPALERNSYLSLFSKSLSLIMQEGSHPTMANPDPTLCMLLELEPGC